MIIGILTYHSVANFGANLQALSTIEFLKKTGHTPIVINWLPEDLQDQYKKNVPQCQSKVHEEFVEKYLPISKLCKNESDIIEVIETENIQKIIIGSDAVLKHETFFSRIIFPTKKIFVILEKKSDTLFPNPFWGCFRKKSKKPIQIAIMSASSQNAEFRFIFGRKKREMRKSLLDFSYISVRDSWTQEMISYLTNGYIVPDITPDPVFAFNQNVNFIPCKNEILRKYGLPEKYVLVSFKNEQDVTETWLEEFSLLMEKKDCACVAMAMPEGVKFKNAFAHRIDVPLPPLDWYALIKYSQGYVGHNMHPIIVAIHNCIPFFCFDFYGIKKLKFFVDEKSSKIYDLLLQAGLQSNRITTLINKKEIVKPKIVAEMLTSFNYEKCNSFRNEMYSKYIKMMDKILFVLSLKS